ncbi:MAG TPA: PIN domain-containing protein [Acidimicrobiales bacterium]|nr:PIN domain-containing protein [Acidimicrobiales bacterium]
MARLILDTGVIIAGARRQLDVAALAEDDDVAIPTVAMAEYVAGTLLDTDPGRAAAQRTFLDEVLAVVPIHDYDRRVAAEHAELLVHVRRSGNPRGTHDLIIAATARANNRIVLTTDVRAHFGELPGVRERLSNQ